MSFAEPARVSPTITVDRRSVFLVRTYAHLFGAIAAFVATEISLFQTGIAYHIASAMLSTSWLVVLGAFIVVSWVASHFAFRSASLATQYAALAGFVLAEAVVFVPLLVIAEFKAPGVIESAAAVTLAGFTALTAIVFLSRKDFSFLGGLLGWAGVLALMAIVGSTLFHFTLGTYFSFAMVGLAGAAILYDTSKILHHFPEDRYVSAALELFSSVALMFWYVLNLFLSRD